MHSCASPDFRKTSTSTGPAVQINLGNNKQFRRKTKSFRCSKLPQARNASVAFERLLKKANALSTKQRTVWTRATLRRWNISPTHRVLNLRWQIAHLTRNFQISPAFCNEGRCIQKTEHRHKNVDAVLCNDRREHAEASRDTRNSCF